MAQVSNITKALAAAASLDDVVSHHPSTLAVASGAHPVGALATPPASISPDLRPHDKGHENAVIAPAEFDQEVDMQDLPDANDGEHELHHASPGVPLSKGALSGLDASAAITPSLLAKEYLPAIMLGNGPRPIRYVMGELTHSVPGFSRIPPAKARRLVVAALESRQGGGPDGTVAFFKTGWGRWDAHVIGSTKDSGIGSFGDGHLSPPRSELSSYAYSHGDSGVHLPRPRMSSAYRDHRSGGSWTASSLREEDEDRDMLEHEADKMSLDGVSADDALSTSTDETDDEDWAAVGADALRKASLPTPGAPRWNYQAIPITTRRPSRDWSRRPSGISSRPPLHPSTSLPQGCGFSAITRSGIDPSAATPEERAAVAALLSLGASM